MEPKDLELAIKEGAEAAEELKDALRGKGFFAIIKAVIAAVPGVMFHVEAAGVALDLKGSDKRKLAIDIIMTVVRPRLPWWALWIPFEEILGAGIDAMAGALNDAMSKEWLAK